MSEDLEGLLKQLAKLNEEDRETILQKLRTWKFEEQNKQEAEDQKKLTAFAKAVRKSGVAKKLKNVKASHMVKTPATLYWEYGNSVADLESPEDITIEVTPDTGRDDDLWDKAFKKEAEEMRSRVYKVFKTIEAMAKEHGVEDLDWEDAVLFLWEA